MPSRRSRPRMHQPGRPLTPRRTNRKASHDGPDLQELLMFKPAQLIIILVAAALAVAAPLAVAQQDPRQRRATSTPPPPQPPPAAAPADKPTAPADYVKWEAPDKSFSLSHPKGWEAQKG